MFRFRKVLNYVVLIIILSSHFTLGQIINTIAGNGSPGYSGDGIPAISSQLKLPSDVAIDVSGNIYIADFFNCRIRRVNSSGIITTIAGNGVGGYSGDGGIAQAAQINAPAGIAIDASGNIYIADTYNHRVRKINTSGIISTIAGNGVMGYGGDGGPALNCSFNYPWSVKIDASGNIYIADTGNQRVRKIDPSGIITTIAGNGTTGFSGDGFIGTLAQLNSPQGVAVDATGNVFISDKFNNRIRKVSPTGIITTIAGTGFQGYWGDGMNATNAHLYNPVGIATDGIGNVYFADYLNNRIRMINLAGVINTVVGSGIPGFFGDGGLATTAQIYQPFGLGVDAAGNIWAADTYNHRIRYVSNVLSIDNLNNAFEISIYPNPSKDYICFELKKKSHIQIVNLIGEKIFNEILNEGDQRLDFSHYKGGIYFISISEFEANRYLVKKLVIE